MTGPTLQQYANGGVSFWVKDAGGRPVQRPALDGNLAVDVAIVGAGYTGLWTAYYLKKARPALDIVVIEKEFAGFGASGRNGGWMSAEPAGQFRRYAKDRGSDAAKELQRQMFHAIDEAATIAEAEGFGDATLRTGLIHVATNQAQLGRARHHVEGMLQQGWGQDDVQLLSADEVSERINIAGALGGYGTQHCVRVHPAKFVFGLAKAVERLGVTIYEGTTAREIAPHAVVTDKGTVAANHIVQALEGYTVSMPDQKRRLLPMNSSMLITEKLPDEVFDTIGWAGSELLGDVAHSFSYLQKTADNRIAVGGRGVPYNFASGFDPDGSTAQSAVNQLHHRLGELFPVLKDARIDHTWTGVLGTPRDWSAAVTCDKDTGILRVGGYTGHGVSGTNLAARTARDLILGEDTELTRLPWVGRTARNWEPEPIRWFGARALYLVYGVADQLEYRSSSTKTNILARIADLASGR